MLPEIDTDNLSVVYNDCFNHVANVQLTIDIVLSSIKPRCRDCLKSKDTLLQITDILTGFIPSLMQAYNLGVCDYNDLNGHALGLIEFIDTIISNENILEEFEHLERHIDIDSSGLCHILCQASLHAMFLSNAIHRIAYLGLDVVNGMLTGE